MSSIHEVRDVAILVLLMMSGHLLGIDHGIVLLFASDGTRSRCHRLLSGMRMKRCDIVKELTRWSRRLALLGMLRLSSLCLFHSFELALN